MMVKLAQKPIFILEFDGSRSEFNPAELQTRLIGCFLAAGLGESSYMAEDIALAVEYTLRRCDRPESLFGRGELNTAVIRMLEETGLPEVAKRFRQEGAERRTTIDADLGSIAEFLRKFLAYGPERFTRVATLVAEAAQKLGIEAASPHLLLELARHYEQNLADTETPPVAAAAPPEVVATAGDLLKLLPGELEELTAAGVIRLNGITTLFRRIQFFFSMERFAEYFRLVAPVTEIEIDPLLYRMSLALEQCRGAIAGHLDPDRKLPVYLSIPDMTDFVVDYLGGERQKARHLGLELGRMLYAELDCETCHLSIS